VRCLFAFRASKEGKKENSGRIEKGNENSRGMEAAMAMAMAMAVHMEMEMAMGSQKPRNQQQNLEQNHN